MPHVSESRSDIEFLRSNTAFHLQAVPKSSEEIETITCMNLYVKIFNNSGHRVLGIEYQGATEFIRAITFKQVPTRGVIS